MLTSDPDVNSTELKLMSEPLVPISPSIIPALVSVKALVPIRNQAAVPAASADESAVIELAVAVPLDAAPNAVALNVSVARIVSECVVLGLAGCVPAKILSRPSDAASIKSTKASHIAFCAAVLILKLLAKVIPPVSVRLFRGP